MRNFLYPLSVDFRRYQKGLLIMLKIARFVYISTIDIVKAHQKNSGSTEFYSPNHYYFVTQLRDLYHVALYLFLSKNIYNDESRRYFQGNRVSFWQQKKTRATPTLAKRKLYLNRDYLLSNFSVAEVSVFIACAIMKISNSCEI
jgi:hypothetical protein